MDHYCSVKCCQAHKESCKQMPKDEMRVPPLLAKGDELPPKHKGEESNEEGDAVPVSTLQKLDCDKVKAMLANPHLRRIMTEMAGSGNSAGLMEAAMKEPIFTEFATQAMEVVGVDTTEQ